MEYKKVIDLLGGTVDITNLPKYTTVKWIEVYGESVGTYNPNKNFRFKAPELRNYLCNWSDAYLIVTGKISVTIPNDNAYDKKLAPKNNVPFITCVTRINNVLIDHWQDLDLIMPMYNLTSYSKNYQKTSGSLWNYYRDEPSSGVENNINYSVEGSKSFDYKTDLVRKLEGKNRELENIKITVPIKYLSKFFRSLEIPLINCEIYLDLK